MTEIRCECSRLLAVKANGYFEIKSKHDKIHVAFPFGRVECTCGKEIYLNPFVPFTYSLEENTIYKK